MKSKRQKKHIPGSRIQRWFGSKVNVFWKDERDTGRAILLDIGFGCIMLAADGEKGKFGFPEMFPLEDIKFMELVEEKA